MQRYRQPRGRLRSSSLCRESTRYLASSRGKIDRHCRKDMPIFFSISVLGLYFENYYHQRHASTLYQTHKEQQPTKNLPSCFPFLFPTAQNYNECDQYHTFHDHRKGHQKANRSPHRAEGTFFAVAFFILGKAYAAVREGGATFMKAVSIMDVRAIHLYG